MSDDLLIKISADAKDVKTAYEDIKHQTDDLDESLSKIAKISGAIFAALAADVALSVHAFIEADTASRALNQTLQNQGIYSDDLRAKYNQYAEEIQKTTRFGAEEVTQSQAILQSYLGQLPITEELTKATADLAQAKGITLTQASVELGKAISQGTGQLLREGIQFNINSNEAERYAQTLSFVENRYGGVAAAANPLSITMSQIEHQFHDSAVLLGEKFAPALNAAGQAILNFITPAKQGSDEILNFKFALVVVGLALSGIGVVLPIVAQAILTLRAAFEAMNIALNATKIALAGLGIGLLIIALTELVLHWDTVSQRIMAIVHGLVTSVTGAFAGLKDVITGAMHLDTDKIKQGMAEVQEAFKSGWNTATAEIPKATKKALEEHTNLVKQQTALDREFGKVDLATRKELAEQGAAFDANIDGKELAKLKASLETKQAAKRKVYTDDLKLQIASHNKTLEEQQKYGVAYAAINETMRSSEVQGTKQASSELVALTQSKNQTLKDIGKVASIANIVIKTAESAMNIYAGFSAIPFIGPALGIAGAAAAVAFGAEQIGQVTAAESGALVQGVGYGDKIPFMLEPGELVAPRKNFDEVVQGVAQQRGYTSGENQQQSATVEIRLKDGLMDFIEAKLVQRRFLNISIQGKS